MFWICYLLLTRSFFFISMYLATAAQSSVGCFSVVLPSLGLHLGPTLVESVIAPGLLWPTAAAKAWTAAFEASTTACTMASVIDAWSVTILPHLLIIFAETALLESAIFLCCLCLLNWDLLLTPCNVTYLSEDNTKWCLHLYLLLVSMLL